ncbi:MAG: outer membrane lipoprotein-sorting protein [Spirochaetaceae bacterium]
MKLSSIVYLILFLAAAGTAPLVHAEPERAEARDRLERADANWSYPESDFAAEYRVVQEIPGEGRSETLAAVFRRDAEDIYTIVILEPRADRGQGYLKQGDTLWVYDPESDRFNTTSSRERFQNTNARNSDFTRSTLAEDYEIQSVEETTLGRFDAYLYELESDKDGVSYPYMKAWITEDGRILKTEDYSRSRRLLRVTAAPDYREVGSKLIPEKIHIIDMLEGEEVDGEFENERTTITITEPTFEPVPDSVFSRSFLERMSR